MTSVPVISTLPPAPIWGTDTGEDFSTKADALLGTGLPTLVTELNAFAPALVEAASVANYSAASTTSLLVGTGAKSLVVQDGKMFVAGTFILIADANAPTTNWMFGQVTSYDFETGDLDVEILLVDGSGTFDAWFVVLSSPRGPGGENGDNGTNGNTVLSGAGAPGGGVGVDGDYYIDLTAKFFYGPKAAGSWPAGFSIVGPGGGVVETIYQITDGAGFTIDPANGGLQYITLGANRTPVGNFLDGSHVTLMIDDGSARTINWTSATFGGSGVAWQTDSGVAPILATTGYTTIILWKLGTQVYGARVGNRT